MFPEEDPMQIHRSKLISHTGKWQELTYNGQKRSASGVYNFVTLEGKVFIRKASARLGNRLIGHIDLALGKAVDYAGRLYFSGRTNRGILRKWTNESGHYRPSPELFKNASLPEELFEAGHFNSLISII